MGKGARPRRAEPAPAKAAPDPGAAGRARAGWHRTSRKTRVTNVSAASPTLRRSLGACGEVSQRQSPESGGGGRNEGFTLIPRDGSPHHWEAPTGGHTAGTGGLGGGPPREQSRSECVLCRRGATSLTDLCWFLMSSIVFPCEIDFQKTEAQRFLVNL